MAVHCQLDLYFLLGSWWFTIISHVIFIVINFHHHCSYWSHKVKILWNTLGTFVCSFAHLSVCPFVWVFFWNQSIKFSNFLHEHRMAKSNFWKKNILFSGVLWFFKFYEKSTCGIFQIFCMRLQQQTKRDPEWAQRVRFYIFFSFCCIKLQ